MEVAIEVFALIPQTGKVEFRPADWMAVRVEPFVDTLAEQRALGAAS